MKKLLISILLISCNAVLADIESQRVKPNSPLVLLNGLKSKTNKIKFQFLRNFLIQKDDWSCGLRIFFHIQCIEHALQYPYNFEPKLKKALGNANRLMKMYENNRRFDHIGLAYYNIQNLANNTRFKNRILFLEKSQGDVAFIKYRPKKASYDFSHGLPKNKKMQKLKQVIHNFFKNNQKAKALHIPVVVYYGPNHSHWVLISAVRLPKRAIRLYILDSGYAQNSMDTTKRITPYLNLLLPHIE